MEIVRSFSGKLNTGNYNQESIFYSLKKEIPDNLTIEEIRKESDLLSAEVWRGYKEEEARVKNIPESPTFSLNDFYYIRVSRVLQEFFPIPDSFPKDALQIYADNGTIHHKIIQAFFESGEILTPQQADPELYKKIKAFSYEIRGKTIKIDPDTINFGNYWEEHGKPYKVLAVEQRCHNPIKNYAGTYDALLQVDNEYGLGDWKTSKTLSKDKIEKFFLQMAAYSLCQDLPHAIDFFVIFALQGKPIVTHNIEQYHKKWTELLKQFMNKYKEK